MCTISLGLYISERNTGQFQDTFITFSARPKLQVLNGNLMDRMNQLVQADWGMNTDLEPTFALILDQACQTSSFTVAKMRSNQGIDSIRYGI